jgi:hypothetical protein
MSAATAADDKAAMAVMAIKSFFIGIPQFCDTWQPA